MSLWGRLVEKFRQFRLRFSKKSSTPVHTLAVYSEEDDVDFDF